ncbi:MAG: amidohydrolase [Candidatus Dormibacteraeota bacterium]|nr:amidohydrolase [Candidatus Dormibacteraeota bacterium]
MYTAPDGTGYFVVDGHIHYWDASPANQRNKYGEGFIGCFYDYHANLSPPEWVWPREKFEKYDEATMMHDLYDEGYVDVGIFQPTYLTDFYTNGFNTTARDAILKEKYPDRFVLNTSFEPREGAAGIPAFKEKVKRYGSTGVKLYTAEWKGDSRGWKLTDDDARRYLDACVELGVVNIHVHKGPTIWPLNKDAFDVSDVDHVATEYRDAGLRFIVEHVGMPRVEDFNWIAVQEPNVYGGLAVCVPFIHARPRYFAEVLSELLFWVGEDRLLFASDYAIWHPKWIVEKLVAFDLPDDLQQETGVKFDAETKKKLLGLNAAALYGLDVPANLRLPEPAGAAGE